MKNEVENIKERYAKRRQNGPLNESAFSGFVVKERNSIYQKQIQAHFPDISVIRVLEIGAGGGANIGFFKEMGIKPGNIHANELLAERAAELEKNHPDIIV